MKKILAIALLLIVINFAAVQAIADMYIWVDQNGVVHFSDDPPTSEQNVEILETSNYQEPPQKTGTDQTLSEQQAAEETYFEGLRFLGTDIKEPRLKKLNIYLGYVENDTKPGGGKYFCGALTRRESLNAGKTIIKALSTLSDTSIKKIGLKYVILCGRAMAGGQRIGGIPLPPLNLLMLDIGKNRSDSLYLQRTFLHELYHLAEFRFNTFRDKRWQKRFGEGYANSYSGYLKQSPIGSGRQGFLNAYSETYPHEERAELFAYLLLMPAKVITHIRSTDDQLLKEKVQYLAKKAEQLMEIRLSLRGL